MGNKLITQIILIATALVIIFVFIKPTFTEITSLRDELYVYSGTIDKVGQLNVRLNELSQEISSFSEGELFNLERFIPSKLDSLAIMKDISFIVERNGGTLVALASPEEIFEPDDVYLNDKEIVEDSRLNYQDFELSFNASYNDMQEILYSFESNAYLLEVVKLEFSDAPNKETTNAEAISEDSDFFTYNVTLRAYTLAASNN